MKNRISLDTLTQHNKAFLEITSTINIGLHYLLGKEKLINQATVFKNKESLILNQNRFQPSIKRDFDVDRIFPLDSICIKTFETKHDTDINTPFIHAGPSADEFARSLNALAVTIGYDIYFRNGAYKPESEEGRSILAHELTHIKQYKETRITGSDENKKTLEQEAEISEKQEQYEDNPYIQIPTEFNTYKIRKKDINKIVSFAAKYIEDWLTEQKHTLPECDYLELLCDFQSWTNGAD